MPGACASTLSHAAHVILASTPVCKRASLAHDACNAVISRFITMPHVSSMCYTCMLHAAMHASFQRLCSRPVTPYLRNNGLQHARV